MQHAGQQYGQGAVTSHQGTTYGPTDSSSSSTGSITSSLRQFRKKDVDKQQVNDNASNTGESHVARVAPHNHYPNRSNENFRYQQFTDYSVPPQVKYSDVSDLHTLQEPVPPSVIQKPKGKEYMDMCNVQQNHIKQSYTDHLNGPQYAPDTNLHPHPQYPHKDHQVHPFYKSESQYFPKEAQYHQQLPQIQKYNMPPAQMRKYPPENDFLSKLRRIHPSMARSIMSDHHLQESQPTYQTMDQNRMYPHQNQRYMNYSSSLQGNPYPHNYMPPQNYPNYPPSCSYTRPPQVAPRFPPINPHERSISPRRGYSDNLPIPPINYAAVPQKVSPNYPQYNPPEYAQHYQHRRAPQDYYQQHLGGVNSRSAQYLPHQMTPQEITENRVTVSDSIKQYIENWADEETASEMNQIENNRLCKESLRVRDDQSTETVYMINASELQYLENGIPLVTSESGIPLVASENGQYIIKSGVAIDNSTGMVRIMEKNNQIESSENNGDRVVNLHIMDTFKPDCMLANKPNELNQRPDENLYHSNDKPKVVIHQNTVIQPSHQNPIKEVQHTDSESKVNNSLPIITENDVTEESDPLEKIEETIFKDCKKEMADKNCSPINVAHMEDFDDFKDNASQTSVICTTKPPEQAEVKQDEVVEDHDSKLANDIELPENGSVKAEEEPTQLESVKNENEVITDDLKSICETREHTEDEKFVPNGDNCGSIEDIKNETKSEDEREDGVTEERVEANNRVEDEEEGRVKEEPVIETLLQLVEDPPKEENVRPEEEDKKTGVDTIDAPTTEKMDVDTIIEEKIEDTLPHPEDISETTPVEEDALLPDENEKINELTDAVSENTNQMSSMTSVTSNQLIDKPKRTRRIFSVDDIINNIGTNMNKSKNEKELAERRRSIHTTREFLEIEVENSRIFVVKRDVVNDSNSGLEIPKASKEIDKVETETPDVIVQQHSDDIEELAVTVKSEEAKCNETSVTENFEESGDKTNDPQMQSEEKLYDIPVVKEQSEENCNNTSNFEEGGEEKSNACADWPKSERNIDLIVTQTENVAPKNVEESIEKQNEEPSESTTEKSISHSPVLDILEHNSSTESPSEHERICARESEITSIQNVEDGSSQNEVHYRNAIRVEENNVLLEIAGELVEINVATVNGKKVITVVPLSETTVVDCNDNYETLENSVDDESQSKIHTSALDDQIAEIMSLEEVVPETEVIETTSEIIIGMDISLEEEIQLDLEKPPVLCTKAAKKSYENDLQIPSITTSEDVNDNNKRDCDNVNDKVSSSKEQSPTKEKSEKKRSDKVHSSKKIHDSSKDLSVKSSESNKRAINELLKVRKVKKDEKKAKEVEEEEFVPFKDLVKARNLKKQKLQQLKSSENVSADSTNKIDNEEISSCECDSKEKKIDKEKKRSEEDVNKSKLTEKKDSHSKAKDHKLKNYRRPSKVEDKNDDSEEKSKPSKEKTDNNKVNSSTNEKNETLEKCKERIVKKVTFGTVDYKNPEGYSKNTNFEIRNYRLEDPRLKKRPSTDVLVPSVSEILKENSGMENSKKKLSLEEYNRRKRKLSTNQEEREVKVKKNEAEEKVQTDNCTLGEKKVVENRKSEKFKLQRPKSLDDLKVPTKPKDGILAKRKFSLEESFCRPNHFDWEETQSPKTNLTSREKSEKRLSEFSGLINNNKSKIVIDINDLNPKPMASESSEDEILQIYKEQVDSKLSSLSIQIPRVVKPPNNLLNPFSNPETNDLMERFLKNEKVTIEEMEKIKQIIAYKRLVQQLNKIKSPEITNSPLNPTYEIRKNCAEKDMKLHLKKVSEKKKKRRFRNLYSDSTTESDSDFSETKETAGDYSVVQSNCYAAGVPKLIIKRKTEMPVPVVRLERLDLGLLVGKKRKIY